MTRSWDRVFGAREPPAPAPPVGVWLRCASCGTDVSDLTEHVCSQCGAARSRWTPWFFNAEDAVRAVRALSKHTVPHDHQFTTVPVLAPSGSTPSSTLRIDEQWISRAVVCFEAYQIAFAAPMAWRSVGRCPVCVRRCDPDTMEVCPACGVPIRWVNPEDVTALHNKQERAIPEVFFAIGVSMVWLCFSILIVMLHLRTGAFMVMLTPVVAVAAYFPIERALLRRKAAREASKQRD